MPHRRRASASDRRAERPRRRIAEPLWLQTKQHLNLDSNGVCSTSYTMLTKADLEALATARLDDALFLFRAGRASSAYYLVGYAVELALKACIAKAFHPDAIPDRAFVLEIYTHRLTTLLGAAGLKTQFDADSKADPQLAASWGIVSQWTETSRYSLWDSIAAGSLVAAVADQDHGVFQWVKKHW